MAPPYLPLQDHDLCPAPPCTEFPSEALAQRLRMAGRLLQFTLALVLLKAVGSAAAWLQARILRWAWPRHSAVRETFACGKPGSAACRRSLGLPLLLQSHQRFQVASSTDMGLKCLRAVQAAHASGKLQHAWEAAWTHRLELQAVQLSPEISVTWLCGSMRLCDQQRVLWRDQAWHSRSAVASGPVGSHAWQLVAAHGSQRLRCRRPLQQRACTHEGIPVFSSPTGFSSVHSMLLCSAAP